MESVKSTEIFDGFTAMSVFRYRLMRGRASEFMGSKIMVLNRGFFFLDVHFQRHCQLLSLYDISDGRIGVERL